MLKEQGPKLLPTIIGYYLEKTLVSGAPLFYFYEPVIIFISIFPLWFHIVLSRDTILRGAWKWLKFLRGSVAQSDMAGQVWDMPDWSCHFVGTL